MRPSAPGLSLLPLEPQGEDGITIAEVGLRYLDHCQQFYRTPSGKVTSSVDGVQMALRALFPFANLPAARFGAKALKTVQAAMVAEGRPRVGVNRSIKAIRRLFFAPNDSSAASPGPCGQRPRSGSTRPKTGPSAARSSYNATLISSRRCLKVIDTFRMASRLDCRILHPTTVFYRNVCTEGEHPHRRCPLPATVANVLSLDDVLVILTEYWLTGELSAKFGWDDLTSDWLAQAVASADRGIKEIKPKKGKDKDH